MRARLVERLRVGPLGGIVLAAVAACASRPGDVGDVGGAGWSWELPPGFPEPSVPEDNPMSTAKVELGRRLFYDVRLSENETQACASCHLQELAFTDGLAAPVGSTGEPGRRSAPALGNVGYMAGLTWANDLIRTLEHQALLPLFGETPVELGLSGHEEELQARLDGDRDYVERFAASWPDDDAPVSLEHVTDALAAFQRALLTGRSRYDRYVYDDDPGALSDGELRGRALFFSEQLECSHCHGGFAFADSVRHAGTTFDELAFHNTGLYNVDGAGAYPEGDQGLIEITAVASDMGRFRAPSLRNVAVTAPYMHDGSVATLDEVLDHYAAGGRTIADGPNAGVGSANPYKSELIAGFDLTAQDREDLKAFLGALTDEAFLVDPRFADPFAE